MFVVSGSNMQGTFESPTVRSIYTVRTSSASDLPSLSSPKPQHHRIGWNTAWMGSHGATGLLAKVYFTSSQSPAHTVGRERDIPFSHKCSPYAVTRTRMYRRPNPGPGPFSRLLGRKAPRSLSILQTSALHVIAVICITPGACRGIDDGRPLRRVGR